MSRTHLSDDDLVDRLARAFDAEVADVRASTEPFEPVLLDDRELREPRGLGWRRPVIAGAAVAAMVCLAVGAVVVGTVRDEGATPSVGPTPDVETAEGGDEPSGTVALPDGVLAPTFVPDDLTLWGVDWMDAAGGAMFTQQLFQRADGAGLVIEIHPGEGGSSGGDPLTVRGLPATSSPAKEFPETDTSLFWYEGANLTATYAGLTEAEAVALLDSLTWRSDDRTQGFAPPATGDVELRAEAPAGEPAAPVVAARFRYADDLNSVLPGVGRQVEVRTTTGPAAILGASTNLQPLLHGEIRSDGVFEAYDPDFGTLTVRQPDGRSVWIDANGTPVTRDELHAIADGISPATADDLRSLDEAASASVVGATTTVTEASLASGSVTVRRGAAGELVCVAVGGGTMCPGPFDSHVSIGSSGPSEAVVSSLLIDGTWWVAAVGPVTPSVHQMPSVADIPGAQDLPGLDPAMAETMAVLDGHVGPVVDGDSGATSDRRTAVLVRPDPALTSLVVASPGGGSQVVRRPGT